LKLRYEGFFEVSRSRTEVYQYLVNPLKFAKALPGFKKVEVVGEGGFKVDLVVSVGPLRDNAVVVAKFVEVKEDSYAKIEGKGRSVGSTLHFTLTVTVEEAGTGSSVNRTLEGTGAGV